MLKLKKDDLIYAAFFGLNRATFMVILEIEPWEPDDEVCLIKVFDLNDSSYYSYFVNREELIDLKPLNR